MADITLYVTIRQAAEILDLSKSRVEQFIRGGRIPAVDVGEIKLLLRTDVEEFKKLPRGKGRPKEGEEPTAVKPRKRKK